MKTIDNFENHLKCDWTLKTAVAFFIFNRPEVTERVFRAIANAKPLKLLVVADGPRLSRAGEAELCAATRAIINGVNWECEVFTNYSNVNLGCKNRVASGIDWVFEQVESAIILEDDCLPHPSFFRFCDELLSRYHDNEQIGMISGNNFQKERPKDKSSYYFSRYCHIWGWATWRRAWAAYDKDMLLWPNYKSDGSWEQLDLDRKEKKYWRNIFDSVHRGDIDTWDYQWAFALRRKNMATILPNINLISNIGFGKNATHTVNIGPTANMKSYPITFPLHHPKEFAINSRADKFTFKNIFQRSLFEKITYKAVNSFRQRGFWCKL